MSLESCLKLARTMQLLSLDAPRVIAGRAAMLSGSNAGTSARDRAEVTRMFAEKQSAAMESYMSFWADASRQYQTFVFDYWMAFLTGNYRRMTSVPQVSPGAALASINRALKPYQRRASANARRLSR